MTIRTVPRTSAAAATLAFLLGAGSMPVMANPAEPQAPVEVSCIHLPAALSGIETKGLFKVESETRLERGPYISEREDAEGTYYRAPPGGIYVGPPKDKPAKGAWQANRDGGIFVPRDPSAAPQLYSYVTDVGMSAATLVPPAAADCSNTRYIRDAVSKAVRVAGYAGEGMTLTDAKKVGTGGGNLLGGVLGAVLENMDRGKIAKLPMSKNVEFNIKLGQFARSAVPIKALDAPD